jgi:hypothetical protein
MLGMSFILTGRDFAHLINNDGQQQRQPTAKMANDEDGQLKTGMGMMTITTTHGQLACVYDDNDDDDK